MKRLGDLLLDMGKISRQQLDDELLRQRTAGKRLGDILVEDNILTEDDIIEALQLQLGLERVNVAFINVDKSIARIVPEAVSQKYTLIPIGFHDNKLKVAMSDPLNIFAMDDVMISTGYEVEPCIATKKEILEAIDKCYSEQNAEKAAEELSKAQDVKEVLEEDENELDEVKNAPVVKLVDSILKNAIKARASDIHIEPFETYVKVRYRIDGELNEVLKSPKDTQGALTTRIKILADLNIAEKRVPQDGRIITSVDGKEVDLRVSILPTVHGEKVVIRVLERDSFMVTKEKLGLKPEDSKKLDNIVESPYGIILVTGPTGSGKSTTLYTLLNELNTVDKNIITVEDPVEYMLDGINQVNVNTKAGLTFAAGLRSILRQDPDVIMIGEIRDSETAEIAVRAAITGHLVLSTLHTNDAPSAIIRLSDMGLEPFLVSTAICGVIAQRLVRKICPHCREEYVAGEYEKKILDYKGKEALKLYRGAGCAVCNNSGYSGRVGVYEIMEVTREHREYIIAGKTTDELKDLSIKNGMKTIKSYCEKLVLEGTTTIEELVKIAF